VHSHDRNNFIMRCSLRGNGASGVGCSYSIRVERCTIKGRPMWRAVRESPHTGHTVNTAAVLGNLTTHTVKSQTAASRKRLDGSGRNNKVEGPVGDSDTGDDDAPKEDAPVQRHKRKKSKSASPRPHSHPKKKRSRIVTRLSPPPINPPPAHHHHHHYHEAATASTSSNRNAYASTPSAQLFPSRTDQIGQQLQPHLSAHDSTDQTQPTPPAPGAASFAKDLNLFLRSILGEHVTYAPLLIELGITSHSSIASLLMMDKATLDRLGVYLDKGTANHKGIGILARAYFIQQAIKVGKQAKAEFQATV
jgi:hypothetical protein